MTRQVTILGAGLVGSLLSVILRKKGYNVSLYEKGADIRTNYLPGGRSINLTISLRGWKALEQAGIKDEIMAISMPMYGRYMHQQNNSIDFQPYSKNKEAIYSINRSEINKKLLSLAEENGTKIYFNHPCTHIDLNRNSLYFELPDKETKEVTADLLFGADGAFSALRNSYIELEEVRHSRNFINYGYKELSIAPGNDNKWQIPENGLHIWPRGHFMMLAMPNSNGGFRCTLFMPFEGDVSFSQLTDEASVTNFFNRHFADVLPLMPNLLKEFFANPTSSMLTSHISKWHISDKSALIGDSAHTIVPFYGQGMNAGFEDCTAIANLIDRHGDNWDKILEEYERIRKPNTEAIAKLALLNFYEIRNKVADPVFLKRKEIENEIALRYPEKFTPVYEMVSFTDAPYEYAIRCIHEQEKLLLRIMNEGDFFEQLHDAQYISKVEKCITEYSNTLDVLGIKLHKTQ